MLFSLFFLGCDHSIYYIIIRYKNAYLHLCLKSDENVIKFHKNLICTIRNIVRKLKSRR